MKEFVKKVLKSCALGRAAYEGLHKLYKAYNDPLKVRRLHKHGYETLKRLHEAMEKNQIPYYCEAGTLLGFIRDHGFIKHDDDIDIAIMPDTVAPRKVLGAFLASGFCLVHGFKLGGRTSEFTVRDVTGITIDVFFHEYVPGDKSRVYQIFMRWHPDRQYPDPSANNALRFNFVAPTGIKKIVVCGVEANVPVNAEEVLDSEYGPWRKPDPNFKSDSLKYEELDEYSYRVLKEEYL